MKEKNMINGMCTFLSPQTFSAVIQKRAAFSRENQSSANLQSKNMSSLHHSIAFLLLQSSVWLLWMFPPPPYNTSFMCQSYLLWTVFFKLTLSEHTVCINQEKKRCTLSLAVCKLNRYCLCRVFPMLFIFICCESLREPVRPKCALLLTSQH